MAGPDRKPLCLARILGAHGVRGLVKLQSFTDPPQALKSHREFRDAKNLSYRIDIMSAAKDHFLARVEGIADRDAAEGLKGTELYVDRAALPAPADGEFYHADLIGLSALDEAGNTLGKVAALHNFGAGDVLEIVTAEKSSFMIPFTRAFVPRVDLAAGTLTIAAFDEVE